jgi:hypothetical protein
LFILSENQALSVLLQCCHLAMLCCITCSKVCFVSLASYLRGSRICLCMIDIELFLRPQLVAYREENSRNNGKHVLTSLFAMKTGVQPTQSHKGDV